MKFRHFGAALAAAGTLLFSSVPARAAWSADAAFAEKFGAGFLDEYWKLYPDQAIASGYYKGADQLLIPDQQARNRQQRFLEAGIARLRAIDPKSLDLSHRADREILLNQLDRLLWGLTTFRDWQWDPSNYNVADPFALLLTTDFAPVEQRLRIILKRLAAVPAYYTAAKADVENPTPAHTELAITQNKGALDVLGSDLEQQIANANLSPPERASFKARLDAARRAIQDYIDWLQAVRARESGADTRSFRIGKTLYEQKFHYEVGTGGTAEALYQRAIEEKESLLQRMEVLSVELWPKYFPNTAAPTDRLQRIRALIDKLSEQHVAPDQLFAKVQADVPMLQAFVTQHGLLTLDPSKPLQVRITPQYKQGVAGAGIDAPGPYDPTARTYYNVTPPDALTPEKAESYLREYNNWMLPILSIHEAIPGHYVQLVYSNRAPSLIKSLFGNGAMVEGWAVYGERMMMEAGFGGDTAEQWLIYSKWNLRSVVNTILDYGVHVQNLSEADAIKLLTQEAFQSDQEASEKWRRVQLSSVQLTSYFAGYSAIYELRERLKRERPGSFDLRRFHEQFLSYGSAPVGLIDTLMSAAPR